MFGIHHSNEGGTAWRADFVAWVRLSERGSVWQRACNAWSSSGLLRKSLQALPERGVYLRLVLLKGLDASSRMRLCSQLEAELDLPGRGLSFLLGIRLRCRRSSDTRVSPCTEPIA